MTYARPARCIRIAAPAMIATIALGMAVPPIATAVENADVAFETTQDLVELCSTPADDPAYVPAQTACTAFIEATLQYHDAVSDRRNLKRLVCYPAGTSIADGRKALLEWADQHAGDAAAMRELPVIGLVRALAKAYPCK